MKIWTSEHTFSHPWHTVVQAVWRKYPNPMNPAVVGVDIIDRNISQTGIMKTHRLISCEWGLPNWAQKLLGTEQTCYASEHSEVDPSQRKMTLMSKNLSFCNELSIVEKLTYSPHPTQPNHTLLKQEAVVTVHGIPLSSYFEDFVSRNISTNANKGRQAMEYVINKINCEVQELTQKTVRGVDELTVNAKRCISDEFAVNSNPNYHFQTSK